MDACVQDVKEILKVYFPKSREEKQAMEKRYLCLDVGGTSVKYAVCDENGQMLTRGKHL